MAKVFLDTNVFIDAVHRNPEREILPKLENHTMCISPLSVHIYCYAYKIRIPDQILSKQLEKFLILQFTDTILNYSLEGPTNDLEDNIQLHCAAEEDCDYFLTADEKLLRMKFFGKTKILPQLTGK